MNHLWFTSKIQNIHIQLFEYVSIRTMYLYLKKTTFAAYLRIIMTYIKNRNECVLKQLRYCPNLIVFGIRVG